MTSDNEVIIIINIYMLKNALDDSILKVSLFLTGEKCPEKMFVKLNS